MHVRRQYFTETGTAPESVVKKFWNKISSNSIQRFSKWNRRTDRQISHIYTSVYA